jgi:lipid-binding SYLF domain-containing protein
MIPFQKHRVGFSPFRVFLSCLLILVGVFSVTPSGFSANYRAEADYLVEASKYALDSFLGDSNMGAFHDLVRQAKGILIAPQVLKGAFIVGASGGSGVFLALDERQGVWRGPAFYRVGGASFGLQIGGQASEVLLLAMTDRGVSSLLANSIKLGADVGIAAGPIGAGVSAASANLSADLLSFSRSKGLYGGVSLDGAIVAVRHALNEAYYKKKTDASDILIRHEAVNPQASGLIESVRKATGRK